MHFMPVTMDVNLNDLPENHFLVVHPLDDVPEEKIDTANTRVHAHDHQREAFAVGSAQLPRAS